MLADGKAGEFDVIVALHLDRLTRSVKDYLPLVELAERYHVGTTTVNGELDLVSDQGQMLAGVLAVFAQGEIKRKGKRQMLANEQRATDGRPSQGGRRAFGFEPDKVTIRESEAALIRQGYEAVLVDGGGNLAAIARSWTEAGTSSTRGLAWTGATVKLVLVNPRNAGIRVHRGVEVGKAVWKPIIDEPTFRAAVTKLADPSRRTNFTGGERRHLMTGLGICAECGRTVVSGGRSEGTTIYRCSGPVRHLSRLAIDIDEFVTEVALARFSRPDAAELLVDRDAPDVVALNSERVAQVGRQEAAAVEFADGNITAAMMRTITEKTNARIAEIDAQLAHVGRERALGNWSAPKMFAPYGTPTASSDAKPYCARWLAGRSGEARPVAPVKLAAKTCELTSTGWSTSKNPLLSLWYAIPQWCFYQLHAWTSPV